MGLKRTNIYLDEKQLERLQKRGEKDHVPVSELVRRAIDAYLAWDDPAYQPTPPKPQTRKANSSPP
jgi:hypothetical protein